VTYSIDVVVTEVIIDFDKYGGEYVKVANRPLKSTINMPYTF